MSVENVLGCLFSLNVEKHCGRFEIISCNFRTVRKETAIQRARIKCEHFFLENEYDQ